MDGAPSQWRLATTAHGHAAHLVSHKARIEDGELVLERVPEAYNTTPFWIVQVSEDICGGHGDIHNPRFRELVEHIVDLNHVYDASVQTWIRADSPDPEPVPEFLFNEPIEDTSP